MEEKLREYFEEMVVYKDLKNNTTVIKPVWTYTLERNYTTEKNKKNNTERLEVEKYCKFCKKHTTHKETK